MSQSLVIALVVAGVCVLLIFLASRSREPNLRALALAVSTGGLSLVAKDRRARVETDLIHREPLSLRAILHSGGLSVLQEPPDANHEHEKVPT
jgi:hypothetical protein